MNTITSRQIAGMNTITSRQIAADTLAIPPRPVRRNFKTMSMEQLLEAYNAMATQLGKETVRRFASAAKGAQRCEVLELEVLRRSARAAQQVPRAEEPQGQEPEQETAAPPRVKRETLREQMARYNALAEQARARGIAAKVLGANGTTFASRANGESAIARLQEKLSQAGG